MGARIHNASTHTQPPGTLFGAEPQRNMNYKPLNPASGKELPRLSLPHPHAPQLFQSHSVSLLAPESVSGEATGVVLLLRDLS